MTNKYMVILPELNEQRVSEEPLFIVADFQDMEDAEIVTLPEARSKLRNMWVDTDEEDLEFDLNKFLEDINSMDVERLGAALEGVDYGLFITYSDYAETKKALEE
ncbi:hypothetical protein CPT_Mater237 [Bacillus phage Mater]|uniref:Uncharacterized protein n=1 Tax=Bacillus phage Mater TaxID=1540090 RepID=A0A0A0RP33_9CAUD|nr:hypothetical protein CPT_Mater15 [Bacillus phage Mater]YP_009151196.1 hypothetical protein CPT_Mater237 [Bacillus phage Mater]AIW03172.1 hypothetical protein CPT_Mater15 [Bacillus phage Mater]AIW03394.1 hypothetical protein CPT_Mater237 [Bacillus phage Mater]